MLDGALIKPPARAREPARRGVVERALVQFHNSQDPLSLRCLRRLALEVRALLAVVRGQPGRLGPAVDRRMVDVDRD